MDQATASAANGTASPLEEDIASFAAHLHAGNLAPRTIETYTEACRQFAAFLTAQGMPRTIETIHREHVEAFIRDLLERWKPATAHNRYAGLQALFRWAVDEELVKASPMAKMRPPKIPETPVPVLRQEQLEALLAVAKRDKTFLGRRDHAILRLLIKTGARRAELANLRWFGDRDDRGDVDLSVAGQEIVRVLGKGRRERQLAIDPATAAALRLYLRERRVHPHAHLPWLWVGQKGRLTESGLAQMVRERGRQAGLGDHVHPHQLRHSYAHRAMAAGMTETNLMRLAGWRSPAMLRRYASSAGTERALAAQRALNAEDDL